MKRIGLDIDDTLVESTKFAFDIYNKSVGKTKSIDYETHYVFGSTDAISPEDLDNHINETIEKHFKRYSFN